MRKVGSVFWGILIIIVGIIFLGNTYDLWNLQIFFEGWWTLFIIIPSICGLLKKEWASSILGICIGLLLFLACQDFISWSMVGKSFLPIVLIVIGCSLIFKPTHKVKISKGKDEYIGVFSSNEQKVAGNFDGSSIVAVFGGVTLDLREATIKKSVVIDAVSVFGSIDIILPDGVKVKTSGVPIFGGIENKYESKEGAEFIVQYVAIFGGIDLK